MLPEIYLIADDLPGSLFIMPCPSGNNLRGDIKAYRARDVDVIVSMLASDEENMLGLSRESTECADVGIAFVSCPIVDFGLPDPTIYDVLVDQITDRLRAGQKVAVHCRAGIGRSGMVTAGVLIALGADADTAVVQITNARGISIPDTVEQGKFIAEYQARNFVK